MDFFLRQIGLHIDSTRELIVASLILVRTMPMIFLSPFFGGKLAPSVVKMGFGGVIALLVWPTAREVVSGPMPDGALPLTVLFLKETFIGMVLGFINMEVFFAMEVAGRIIDTARGTGMAEVMDPHMQQRVSPTGEMYYQLMLLFFMAAGGHLMFLEAYAMSFQLIPIDGGYTLSSGTGGFMDLLMQSTNEMLKLACLLALPCVAATLITDIVFGLLNRVSPQLNAYFMAMPVKAMGGLMMILVIMDAFVTRTSGYTLWALQLAEHTIETLSGKVMP